MKATVYRAREFFIHRPKCVDTRGQHAVLELVYGCNQNMRTSTDLMDRRTIRLRQNKHMMTSCNSSRLLGKNRRILIQVQTYNLRASEVKTLSPQHIDQPTSSSRQHTQ